VESAAVGIAVAGLDARIVQSNPMLQEMLGYTARELAGMSICDFTHADDVDRTLSLLDELAAGKRERYQLEKRYVRADASVFWGRVNTSLVRDGEGRPELIVATIEDVDARRHAEARLAEAETRYRTLVEQLPLVTYIDAIDDVSSNIYTSPQLEAVLGYSVEEWRADRELFVKLLHPDDRDRVLREIAEATAAGTSFASEYRLHARDGSVIWFRDESVTIRDEHGVPAFDQGYLLDITERKAAEEEREELVSALAAQNEQLLELDRMKDEFVALVSHELRTPLTSILGYLDLILEGEVGDLTEQQRQFLSIVERNSNRLLGLVSDLLFVAQIEAGKLAIDREDVDLSAIADDCVEAARPRAAEKEIRLELSGEPRASLAGDRLRLAQLVDNLVSNAIKFTEEGGRVEVRVERSNGSCVVTVSDTGIGLGPDEVAHLFERFYRSSGATERAIQGTGLGLTITKAIAEAHGGSIAVESTPGAGTTFVVELPVGLG
jgi:PAS domain S-box-containing protein